MLIGYFCALAALSLCVILVHDVIKSWEDPDEKEHRRKLRSGEIGIFGGKK